MKYQKFFDLAKKAGIEQAELYISAHKSLSVSLFHGKIDNNSLNDGLTINARGCVNGKFGTASCDVWNKDKAEYLVKEIAENAKVIENDDPIFIYKGSEKYHKVNCYNKPLTLVKFEDKLQKLHELEEAIKTYDPRIIEVQQVNYAEETISVTIVNSFGLKLVQKSNYFVISGAAIAKEGEQVKSGYDLILDNDFNKADMSVLAKKIGENVIGQLGGTPCESKAYKAILSGDVVASLIREYISHASAEEVQKKSSLFMDKVLTKIASARVSIEECPLKRNVFARWFDDEGVATHNKFIIKNGVLQGYLYNLTTAAKDQTTSTGNGYLGGGKMVVDTAFITMRKGKKSLEDLMTQVKDGIYITDVSGLNAGMNSQSGNFSLQATGFMIKDGKKSTPTDLITVAGNLLEIFKDVTAVGNDTRIYPNAVSCQSVIVRKIRVAGK